MFLVTLYFMLNFLGFLIFYIIWCQIPKPKPFDYTTIPGLKLPINHADDLPSLVMPPGYRPEVSKYRGNIASVESFKNSQTFFHYLHLTFGPLNSFWWSSRYVVTVSSASLVSEIKKNAKHTLAISPFAFGSYLLGDRMYCSKAKFISINFSKIVGYIEKDHNLNFDTQEAKFMNKTNNLETNRNENNYGVSQIIRNLRQMEIVNKEKPKKLRRMISDILLVVFDKEIWLDGHPIPKYIPIMINTKIITSKWSDEEFFNEFSSLFSWLPGFNSFVDSF